MGSTSTWAGSRNSGQCHRLQTPSATQQSSGCGPAWASPPRRRWRSWSDRSLMSPSTQVLKPPSATRPRSPWRTVQQDRARQRIAGRGGGWGGHRRDAVLARGGQRPISISPMTRQSPFTVAVGATAVSVLGTQFDIVRREQGLSVSVERGLVSVSAARMAAKRCVCRPAASCAAWSAQPDPGCDQSPSAEASAWRGRTTDIPRLRRWPDVAEDLSRYAGRIR